jgi:uncharacterized phiE125 gp8 family phage protein
MSLGFVVLILKIGRSAAKIVALDHRYLMYNATIYTQPTSEPVSVDDLKAQLRLNTDDEDDAIEEYITTARQQFEHLTQRPVLAQTIRQYCSRMPSHEPCDRSSYEGIIYLMKGNVQSVTQVKYYDQDNTLQTSSTHTTDLTTNPARITWQTRPDLSELQANPLYVDYVCGFTVVPNDVKVALKMLAGHYFENRSAFVTDNLKELPIGFLNICSKYSCQFLGSWGM